MAETLLFVANVFAFRHQSRVSACIGQHDYITFNNTALLLNEVAQFCQSAPKLSTSSTSIAGTCAHNTLKTGPQSHALHGIGPRVINTVCLHHIGIGMPPEHGCAHSRQCLGMALSPVASFA